MDSVSVTLSFGARFKCGFTMDAPIVLQHIVDYQCGADEPDHALQRGDDVTGIDISPKPGSSGLITIAGVSDELYQTVWAIASSSMLDTYYDGSPEEEDDVDIFDVSSKFQSAVDAVDTVSIVVVMPPE